MNDDILDKSEFDEEDDGIVYTKGGYAHPKIIPVMLRPEVVFPFQVTHLEIHDAAWKKILDKVHKEKSVVGFMYQDTEDLPELGRVAISAVIETIDKTVSGSYLVKFIPINRFFTKEYIETAPVLLAEVSYYWDHHEKDEELLPLLEEFVKILHRAGKISQSKTFSGMTVEQLREDIQLYSFTFFKNNPKLTKLEELYALWMYKASWRLAWLIDILGNSLNPNVERIAKVHQESKNN